MIDHQVLVANAHVERENSLQKNHLEEFHLNIYFYIAFIFFNEFILSEKLWFSKQKSDNHNVIVMNATLKYFSQTLYLSY